MPLTAKGQKILANMEKEYGGKRGKSVFYASINSGRIKGVEGRRLNRRSVPVKRTALH